MTAADLMAQGRVALARGAWTEAIATFGRAVQHQPSAEAYEGMGIACRYLLDAEAAFRAHEAGYRLALDAGDPDLAARLAVQISYDAYAFRGPAEAMGWAERAAMLVRGRPPSVATAFAHYAQGYLALLARHDPAAAQASSAHAAALARSIGATDVELMAVALEGLALVALGEIGPGMAKLDAATASAVGGEMTDADSIETVCCFLIDACKRVRDIERASEWCVRVSEIADRFGDRQMFSVCRVHHADILLWRGDLARADAELSAATGELCRIRPGREADAVVRLAELRRRQGRLDEATALLRSAEGHRFHPLVEGLIALDRNEPAAAAEAAQRFLRRIGQTDRFERVAGLELGVRAWAAKGVVANAEAAASEIAAIAAATASPPLQAVALLAAGRVAAAQGEHTEARGALEDAADLFAAVGARFDAAVARAELAAAQRLDGLAELARRTLARSHEELAAMGARPIGASDMGPLSHREAEVLRLVAQGLSNDALAARLVLSVRTVERHVANIYAKIGVSGRTARAAATAWAHTHGIT